MTDLLSKYKQRLEFLDLATGTQYRYLRVVEMYLHYSKGQLSRDAVESFITLHRETSGTYRRFMMVVLKGLFGVAREEWPFSPREMPKLSTPSRPFFTVEDVERLLEVTKDSPVDHAMVRTAAAVGCRREEIARMLLEDYNPPRLVVKTAKGGAPRTRVLDDETVQVLNRYLKVRKSSGDLHLFVSEQGVAFSVTTLGNRFRRIAKEAGFKKGIGWHALRRGLVTWLFEGGMDIRELQEAFGWQSITMPAQYVQLSPAKVEEKIQAIHPFSREKL